MKKVLAAIAALPLIIALASPAEAATGSQIAYDVSAYYRADLGYMVGWKTPADLSGVTGYSVTASPGGYVCTVTGATAKSCTFPAKTLGYTAKYNFTVSTKKSSVVAGVSDYSNEVTAASIPLAPLALVSSVDSSTQISVAWVPSSNTGGAPLYGYKLTYWKSDTAGSPISSTKVELLTSSTTTALTVAPKFMYIIDVAACNAYGCNSADYWSYANTGVTNVTIPKTVSGGSASTTCFDGIYDANTGETSTASCGTIIVDPSTYPLVDPTATALRINLATKFAQKATLSFAKSYSLATWKTIGVSWFAYFTATSKSVTLGFEATPVITTTTPAVCEIVGPKLVLKYVGTCSISAYVESNGVFEKSSTVTQVVSVTN